MYDEILCDAVLPDGLNPDSVVFQTKSFPDAYGARYTITHDGRVIDSIGEDMAVEGYLHFYTNHESMHEYCTFAQEHAIASDRGHLERCGSNYNNVRRN